MGRADLSRLTGWIRNLWIGRQCQAKPDDNIVVIDCREGDTPISARLDAKELPDVVYTIHCSRTFVEFWGVAGRGEDALPGQLSYPVWRGVKEAELASQLQQLRGQNLQLFSRMEQMEAHVDDLRREKKDLHALPYMFQEFEDLKRGVTELQESCEEKDRVLFYIGEVAALLEHVEEKARSLERKYEMRLSVCLRDVCWVNEPHKLTVDQIKCFCSAVKVLVEGWGRLTREKLNWTAKTLVEAGLSVIPVTDKVAAESSRAEV